MSRRAPAGGYDFGNKRQWRREIWKVFRDHCSVRGPALLMPSLEGDEIDVAKANGFREDQLHVVDNNPAIVATLRKRFPRIKTYGVSAARATERMAKAGVTVGHMNLDLTACVSPGLVGECRSIAASGAMAPHCVVAVNMLRGRETRSTFDYLQALGDEQVSRNPEMGDMRFRGYRLTVADIARLHTILLPFAQHRIWRLLRAGIYKTGPQTMLWFVAETVSAAWVNGWVEGFSSRAKRPDPKLVSDWDAFIGSLARSHPPASTAEWDTQFLSRVWGR